MILYKLILVTILFKHSSTGLVKNNHVLDSETGTELSTAQSIVDPCDGNQCIENSTQSYLDNSTDFNVTEFTPIRTEISVLYNLTTEPTETTLPHPNTTSVTKVNPTVVAPEPTSIVNVLAHEDDELCNCDLTSEACDINCCCDSDCTSFDQLAFSNCYTQRNPYPRNHGLCFSTQFIYKNNTQYSVTVDDGGLFCISRDNYPDRLSYKKQSIIQSSDKFNKIWRRKRNLFTWADPKVSFPFQFDLATPYIYGAPLFRLLNSTDKTSLEVLGEGSIIKVPVSMTSSVCDSSRPLQFLVNIKTKCLHMIPNSWNDCNKIQSVAKFVENLVLIASPKLINTTEIKKSSNSTFMKVLLYQCTKDDCNEITSLPDPELNSNNNTCNNLLKRIECVIKHNGSMGLTEGACYIKLQNVSLNEGIYTEEIIINYEWAMEINKTENIFTRSGHPGYVTGKPVISGTKRSNTVLVSNKEEDWLTFAIAQESGLCSNHRRTNIMFNTNTRTQCKLRFPQGDLTSQEFCSSLQDQVWNLMLGNTRVNETSQTKLDTYIASFGDPSPENNTIDWVPIMIDSTSFVSKASTCSTLISSMKLDILYSLVGSMGNPQAKILGASLKAYETEVDCNKNECTLDITSSVIFTDVSATSVSKYAQAPIIKVKLPPDFFYPFVSNGGKNQCNVWMLLAILLINNLYH